MEISELWRNIYWILVDNVRIMVWQPDWDKTICTNGPMHTQYIPKIMHKILALPYLVMLWFCNDELHPYILQDYTAGIGTVRQSHHWHTPGELLKKNLGSLIIWGTKNDNITTTKQNTIVYRYNHWKPRVVMMPTLSPRQWRQNFQWWCVFSLSSNTQPVYSMDSGLLTHWGRVTHIYIGKLVGAQQLFKKNAGILLNESIGTNFSGIWIEILTESVVCEMAFIWYWHGPIN